MQNTRRLTSPAVALLLCGLLVPLGAWARWYQVELLVFLNKDPTAIGTDHWGDNPGGPNLDDALSLHGPRAADRPFALLPPARRKLNAHRRSLDRSGRYETLLHLAWRQPVTGERGARTLSFQLPRFWQRSEPANVWKIS